MEAKQSRSLEQTVLTEIQKMRDEVATLRDFAETLGKRQEGGENFLEVVTRLLRLLVAGTEETHRRLEGLHSTLTEPGITRALRLAILED